MNHRASPSGARLDMPTALTIVCALAWLAYTGARLVDDVPAIPAIDTLMLAVGAYWLSTGKKAT